MGCHGPYLLFQIPRILDCIPMPCYSSAEFRHDNKKMVECRPREHVEHVEHVEQHRRLCRCGLKSGGESRSRLILFLNSKMCSFHFLSMSAWNCWPSSTRITSILGTSFETTELIENPAFELGSFLLHGSFALRRSLSIASVPITSVDLNGRSMQTSTLFQSSWHAT